MTLLSSAEYVLSFRNDWSHSDQKVCHFKSEHSDVFICFKMLLHVFIYASMCFLYMLLYASCLFMHFHTLNAFMLLNAFICFYTLSYAFISFHMLLYTFIRFYKLSYAFIRFHMLSYAFIRFHNALECFNMLLYMLYEL